MSRLATLTTIAGLALGPVAVSGCTGCSKAASKQDVPAAPLSNTASPGTDEPSMGKPLGAPASGAPSTDPGAASADMKLKPEEGTISIEVPPTLKAGAEAVAKIVVTPGAAYHVNTEFPAKVTLQPPAGVTLAKTQFAAGGPDKSKGDAEAFEEQRLAFAVKLTPSASGNYTINGTFKFAVCDKDQCLPKKETIAIKIAAN
ncbi:MAG: hypothetical protein AB7P03_29025 [Kofleriaceae bacterium]